MTSALANKILEKVTAAGATGDLIIDMGNSLSLKANAGILEEQKVTSSQVLGLRVIVDQRVGTAYSESTDDESIEELVSQALTNAKYCEQDRNEAILNLSAKLKTDDAILSPVDNASVSDKIEFALALENTLTQKEKIQNVPYNGVVDGTAQRAIYSTSGLEAISKSRSTYAYAYALATDGDKNAMAGKGIAGRLFTDLNIDDIVNPAWEECVSLLEGKPVTTNHYDVIFDPDQQSSLFNSFSMALSGKSAKEGSNPWRNKVGKSVADKRLCLFDKPTLTEGVGYQLFDAEGINCSDIALIEGGELQTLLHNSATANHFKLESTGHASRGPKSALNISTHQLVIESGAANNSELTASEYLYITNLTGLHSGANAISGDFSFGASGYLCRDGKRTQPVRGITIAGNFYKMLNEISCIGETQHWDWQKSSLMAPVRFSQLAISGK